MEPPATVEAMRNAAIDGDLPELRHLLAANSGLATAADGWDCTPLWHAAAEGREDAVRLLLEAAPAAALTANEKGRLPLHEAARRGSGDAVRLLLETAPTAALTANEKGRLPLHEAASRGSADAVRLLLETAPTAALTATEEGWLPLHVAAQFGGAEAVRLLLEVAPAAALTEADGCLPLEIALNGARWFVGYHKTMSYLEIARLLLPATPQERAISALEAAGEVALPLFADLAACKALSPGQWQHVPAPCAHLGTALPAVLARSAAEAGLLVARLPAETRQRLRTGALCLGRAQREHRVELPAALVGQVLALAAEPEYGSLSTLPDELSDTGSDSS